MKGNELSEIKCSTCNKVEIDIEDLADFIVTNIEIAFDNYENDLDGVPDEKMIIKDSIEVYIGMTRRKNDGIDEGVIQNKWMSVTK